jgi:hypothetical protein
VAAHASGRLALEPIRRHTAIECTANVAPEIDPTRPGVKLSR